MDRQKILPENIRGSVRHVLEKLRMEEESHPMEFAVQLGYFIYLRLFVESQERDSLRRYFPYAGFPMQWARGEEVMDPEQRVWQLQYQIQYCGSVVEEGHFMERAVCTERADWVEELCKLVDAAADGCTWEEGIPEIFGLLLEETIRQIYALGNSGLFLLPDELTGVMIRLADTEGEKRVWNPGCRTGSFLKILHQTNPGLQLTGNEEEPQAAMLARILQFCFEGNEIDLRTCSPLEETGKERWDLIFANPPVGELPREQAERYPVPTRRTQLQYLQMIMERLDRHGQALVVINESTLFKFEAEMKIRKRLVEEFELQGVVSLPAGALLPYTAAKASILIFSNAPERVGENSAVWFYEARLPGTGKTLETAGKETEGDSHKTGEVPFRADPADILESWNHRKELEVEWRRCLAKESRENQWENPVPAHWDSPVCWFADRKTIRRNDYNLTAGRYKPWEEGKEDPADSSPMELLEKLSRMEQDSAKKIQELIEMTKAYG